MVIPDRLPDEYLIEIGRVSVEWALLESALDLCLIKLAGKEILETRSSIIFNHMAFPMKLDVMGALVSELLPAYPGLAGFPGIRQALRQAQEHRNAVIHGKWGVDAETGKVHVSRLSARGKLKVSVEPVSVEEIREMAGFIVKTGQALFSLIMKAGTTNSPPHSGQ